MTNVDDVGRPEPPLESDELGTLLGFLDYQRATLEWKCRGLDEAGLRATTAASAMTLAGVLKHMAWVEDHWFSFRLWAHDRAEPWRSVDWSADRDWEWNSALTDSADEVRRVWQDSVDASRRLVAEALAVGDLSQLCRRPFDDGQAPSLRWVIVHMIEEYARHNGHADLLREAVDGATGE